MSITESLDGAERVRRRTDSAVLRMSETEVAELSTHLAEQVEPGGDERMIMNMGPSHPSTHGVLRLMLELEGETVLRCKPVIGYLHTGMEKTAEQLTFLQGPTNVTRMDYAAPLFNELVFSSPSRRSSRSRSRRGHLDPHADVRAEPHLVTPAVPWRRTAWISARSR